MKNDNVKNVECGCGCGCEHDEEQLIDVVVMQDKDGNDVEFELVATVNRDEKEYVLVSPLEDLDDGIKSGELLIFRVVRESQDSEVGDLIPIESEEELEAVYNQFLEDNNISEDGCCCDDECDCDDDCCGCHND